MTTPEPRFDDSEIAADVSAQSSQLQVAKSNTQIALQALRNALIEGEESGVRTEFDFEAFIAHKRNSALSLK